MVAPLQEALVWVIPNPAQTADTGSDSKSPLHGWSRRGRDTEGVSFDAGWIFPDLA
jgi:hypothetical protein